MSRCELRNCFIAFSLFEIGDGILVMNGQMPPHAANNHRSLSSIQVSSFVHRESVVYSYYLVCLQCECGKQLMSLAFKHVQELIFFVRFHVRLLFDSVILCVQYYNTLVMRTRVVRTSLSHGVFQYLFQHFQTEKRRALRETSNLSQVFDCTCNTHCLSKRFLLYLCVFLYV